MNKFLATGVALATALSLTAPALADSSSSSSSTSSSVASSADLTCMANAVDAREGAVLTARTDFHAKIIATLTTRRASLKTAYTIANNTDRRVAIQTALTVYMKASADATAKYRTDIKAAWKTFTDATVNCRVDADVRVKHESKDDHDNGRHLGQLKKQLKNVFDGNIHGKAKLDLGL